MVDLADGLSSTDGLSICANVANTLVRGKGRRNDDWRWVLLYRIFAKDLDYINIMFKLL